jgi:hypothetical protein
MKQKDMIINYLEKRFIEVTIELLKPGKNVEWRLSDVKKLWFERTPCSKRQLKAKVEELAARTGWHTTFGDFDGKVTLSTVEAE